MDRLSSLALQATLDAAPAYAPFPEAAFQERFHGLAERHGIPAAVAMVVDVHGTLASASAGPAGPSTIFAVASMTKAVTTTAALQLVERSRIRINEPVDAYLPALRDMPVLEGFDTAGAPRFSAARYRVTLHQLLTHTAGFAYPWNHPLVRQLGTPDNVGPYLVHEPGSRWHYGINIDWTGRLIETVSGQNLESYLQEHIFQPLGMTDTSFLVPPEKLPRLISHYQRGADGVLHEQPRVQPPVPAAFNGGGGLFSTANDYVRFLRMLMMEGLTMDGHRILNARSVRVMGSNQIGEMEAGRITSTMPERSCDVDFHPGESDAFGYGFLINRKAYPGGRAAGSLAWAGIRNTFYWLDRRNGIAALLLMQFQPFCDPAAMAMLGDFERSVYAALPETRS